MKDITLNFLDLETTGTNHSKDRIIEVYVTKVKNNETLATFHTFLNPGFRPDSFILNMTSIDPQELEVSPEFEEKMDELFEFLGEDMLVAHNARFDYSFLKSEFARYGINIKNNYCCTVKLSRFLYPEFTKHNLDSIIQRIGYAEDGIRHRADFDTEVIKTFFYKAFDEFGHESFEIAFNKSVKQAAIPEKLLGRDFSKIPDTPGVYIFLDKNNFPLYIGKSIHLRTRIMDHLYNDTSYHKDQQINQQMTDIKIIPTAGEIGALLRESALIKKYQPIYNRALKRNESMVKLRRTYDENGYSRVTAVRETSMDTSEFVEVLGVFGNEIMVKTMLQGYAKKHGLCSKLLGTENGKGACFAYQLGQCNGACIGKVSSEEYNELFDKVFGITKLASWPFEKPIVITERNGDLEEKLLFDKWCFLGTDAGTNEETTITKQLFNLDTYKIIRSFLEKTETISEVISDEMERFKTLNLAIEDVSVLI
ncbi:MAG: exonuclease domain-containing protein [Candidatus Dojkabacteria bacterium]